MESVVALGAAAVPCALLEAARVPRAAVESAVRVIVVFSPGAAWEAAVVPEAVEETVVGAAGFMEALLPSAALSDVVGTDAVMVSTSLVVAVDGREVAMAVTEGEIVASMEELSSVLISVLRECVSPAVTVVCRDAWLVTGIFTKIVSSDITGFSIFLLFSSPIAISAF